MLYSFHGEDGQTPAGGVIADQSGNLYGTTLYGGAVPPYDGYGDVFKLAPDGTETVLHQFSDRHDGWYPEANLLLDAGGNLYGTTKYYDPREAGTVFKIGSDGNETILHVFNKPAENQPFSDLIADSAGNLYGTTLSGGQGHCVNHVHCGAVFKLAPDGTETVLHYFKGGRDGAWPVGGLIFDALGNLYGATTTGGGTGCYAQEGCGTVFKIAPDGAETVLHRFNSNDGSFPRGNLVADQQGNLYGTAEKGGSYDDGTVFKLKE